LPRDDAQQARWNCFARCLNSDLLRAYLAKCPAFEDGEAEERAIALAMAYPNLTQSLCFMLWWPTALGRGAELLLRSMVDDTFTFARSGRYAHAASHLQSCALLSRPISDWGAIPTHDVYLTAIRRDHARKSGFRAKLRELGME
jgi:hypothetical protein